MTPPEHEEPLFSFKRFSLFLVVRGLSMVFLVVCLMGLMHFYIGQRLILGGGLTGAVASGAWVVLALLFFSIPGGFFAARMRSGPPALARLIAWMAFLWLGTFGLLLSAVVVTDLMRALALLLGVAGPAQVARLQALGILGLVVPALAWGLWSATRPVIRTTTIRIPGLGPGLATLKLVQLSDVHIGPTLHRDFLERVVAKVNALAPDIIAITGDLVDGSVSSLRHDVAPLAQLKASLGIYFVTGNHEYYSGAAAWEAEVARLASPCSTMSTGWWSGAATGW